ncbi:MAG TPA: phosphotransferase, partial [Dissulfurispiraceae bacterium]
MHCHTAEHSACSRVSAAELVQRNFEKGLQGTVLTDHHYLWPQEEILHLRAKLKVPDDYLILSGQEITTPDLGDVLVYGADIAFERGTPLAAIRERCPGASLVWAHPYRNGNIPQRDKLLDPLIDGVEILNSNHTVTESTRGIRDWHRYKFTAIAGTDTHSSSYAGTYPSFFDHPVSTMEELSREIKAGRCRPFFKEIPRAGTTSAKITEVSIGTEGEGITRERYIIKSLKNILAWSSAARTSHIMGELARRGFESGRFRIPRPVGRDEESLTVVEQGIQGTTLYDSLLHAASVEAAHYLGLTAEWLARLHNLGLQITPPEEFLRDEPNRLERYLSAFHRMRHPHTRKAEEIMNTVLETEAALFCRHPERMVQGHGDFHPKNILIGKDAADDPSSLFVAAVDFGSSYSMP